MPSRRVLLRRFVTLTAVTALLFAASPASAGALDWVDVIRRRAQEFTAKVRAEWEGLRASQRLAREQAQAQQQVLEQQARPAPPETFREDERDPASVAAAAEALSGPERAMVDAINAERVAAGLRPLTPDLNLITSARAHAAEMRDAAKVFHTPRLAAIVPVAVRGRTIGENVGVGRSAESLQRTFLLSRSHRAAILGRYDRVGIGVIVAPGRTWVTQHFMRMR
jgi:uncharacterized protein YkwD